MEPTTENDPRIAFYEEEGRPIAAAVPAVTEGHQVMGVVYVARHKRTREEHVFFSEELLASLKAFGFVCGDIIARDQSEIDTVRSISRVSTHPLYPLIAYFSSLKSMLQSIADEVRRRV